MRVALAAAPVRGALQGARVRRALTVAPVPAEAPRPSLRPVEAPRPSLRPVEALAARHLPAEPPLLSLYSAIPQQSQASPLLSPQAGEVVTSAPVVTYLYAAVPQPANRREPATGPRGRNRQERPRPAGWSPVANAARRVVVVGFVTALALSVPFGRIVSYVEDHGPLGDAPVGPAQATFSTSLVPGLQLAAVESTATPVAAHQRLTAPGEGALTPIPSPVYAAYQSGADMADTAFPGCGLGWWLLAGIGELESGHAVSGGALQAGWNGTANPPVLGPLLDGRTAGTAVVPDTDGGALDGNASYDRAVGPLQFLPSTWGVYAVDASGDGKADPQNIEDASATAGLYLCAGGADLTDPTQAAAAVRRYNHSDTYVRAVLASASRYLAASYGPGPLGVAQAAIAFGYAHLGDPYQWGGNGPLYDCSGLIQAAYRSAGINLPRTAEQQWKQLPKVPLSDLQPGDLVFFNAGEFQPGLPGHVGIYLGAGYMLDDPHTGAVVRIEKVEGFGSIVGATRPSQLATYDGALVPGTGFVVPPAQPAPAAALPVVTATPVLPPSPLAAPSVTPSAPVTVLTPSPSSVATSTPVVTTLPSPSDSPVETAVTEPSPLETPTP